MNDFMNSTYRKKLIPNQMIYNKEDLYDQNLILKVNLNDFKEYLLMQISKYQGKDFNYDKFKDNLF